ncbi:hypothetical protein HYH03_003268 [Edaphochlamys debaryana]|uniref:Uncharacterized protein n=1 Tax=Edaphochlamys debaryana TaxID=47281 RepID=A0A835YI64_9CHLO|nr:hypothetical protein HYH03_003268 [Edaphochlamys debaryana]|eukprot:KAG2499085.1 hypothetical protein HYH03_003268 [Edaphochlamys debaryana]
MIAQSLGLKRSRRGAPGRRRRRTAAAAGPEGGGAAAAGGGAGPAPGAEQGPGAGGGGDALELAGGHGPENLPDGAVGVMTCHHSVLSGFLESLHSQMAKLQELKQPGATIATFDGYRAFMTLALLLLGSALDGLPATMITYMLAHCIKLGLPRASAAAGPAEEGGAAAAGGGEGPEPGEAQGPAAGGGEDAEALEEGDDVEADWGDGLEYLPKDARELVLFHHDMFEVFTNIIRAGTNQLKEFLPQALLQERVELARLQAPLQAYIAAHGIGLGHRRAAAAAGPKGGGAAAAGGGEGPEPAAEPGP